MSVVRFAPEVPVGREAKSFCIMPNENLGRWPFPRNWRGNPAKHTSRWTSAQPAQQTDAPLASPSKQALSRPFVPVPDIDPKSGPLLGSVLARKSSKRKSRSSPERTSLRKEMKSNRKKDKNAAKRKKRLVKARSSRYSGPVMSFALACIPPCTTCQFAFQSGPPNPDPSQGG